MKLPNKETKASAEAGEGRVQTKENDAQLSSVDEWNHLCASVMIGHIHRFTNFCSGGNAGELDLAPPR